MYKNYNLDHWISTYDFNYYVSEFHPLFLKVFDTIEKSGIDIEDDEYLQDFFQYCYHVVKNPQCLIRTPWNSFKEFVEETKKLPLHDDTNDSE